MKPEQNKRSTAGSTVQPFWRRALPYAVGAGLYFGITTGIEYWNDYNDWAKKTSDQYEVVGKDEAAKIKPGLESICK